VGVVAVIVAEAATANSASARAGTSPSIQTRTNARIAPEREDAPPVATPELSRLEFQILDRSWCPTCGKRLTYAEVTGKTEHHMEPENGNL
jgi:hypothetical protein